MTQTTIAGMTGTVGKISKAGYRRIRGTCVMAANSHHIKKLQDVKLNKALARLEKVNFDMDRLSDSHVEMLYAHFDKKMSQAIVEEYQFVSGMGSIKNNGGCTGDCDICGKGDSRDDGANEDKLRYEFKLTNTAGGNDLWVGSSCIILFGLRVDGAATAGEAKEILRKSLAAHMQQWKIEAWQAEHPDHEEIPAHWHEFRNWRPASFRPQLWQALGLDGRKLDGERWDVWKPFRTASKFYSRKFYLPENEKVKSGRSKTQTWEEVKRLLAIQKWTTPLLMEAMSKVGYVSRWASDEEVEKTLEPAIEFLFKAREDRDAEDKKRKAAMAKTRKAKRCPGKGKKRRSPSRAK